MANFPIMGAADAFGSPMFEARGDQFFFGDFEFQLAPNLRFDFEPVRENFTAALQQAHETAALGALELQKIAPGLLPQTAKLGEISEPIWRALREEIPHTQTHNLSERYAVEHLIYEAARTWRLVSFLNAARENPAVRAPLLRAAGDQLIQSHFSLDHRWKIRSQIADEIVKAARETGPENGVYGARLVIWENGAGVVTLRDSS